VSALHNFCVCFRPAYYRLLEADSKGRSPGLYCLFGAMGRVRPARPVFFVTKEGVVCFRLRTLLPSTKDRVLTICSTIPCPSHAARKSLLSLVSSSMLMVVISQKHHYHTTPLWEEEWMCVLPNFCVWFGCAWCRINRCQDRIFRRNASV